MAKTVSTYSSIYIFLSNGELERVGGISEVVSAANQSLSMLALHHPPKDKENLIPSTFKSFLEDQSLPFFLEQVLFDEAWENAKKGECLDYLSKTHQGAILVEPPSSVFINCKNENIASPNNNILQKEWPDFCISDHLIVNVSTSTD